MTLAEAILEVEGHFQVHREIGQLTDYNDTEGKFVSDGPRDWSRAPNGGRYVTVTSGGMKEQGAAFGAYFSTEDRAVSWWVFSVEDYAETIAPKPDWPKLHLYWRDMPTYTEAEYVALSQAALLGLSQHHEIQVTLGSVYSRMLISKLNPEGKED